MATTVRISGNNIQLNLEILRIILYVYVEGHLLLKLIK